MKITREQFKELYAHYERVLTADRQYENIFWEGFLEQFYMPILTWISEQIGIADEEEYYDMLLELYYDGSYPYEWDEDEEGNCCNIKRTNDLDVLYDKYLGDTENE